MVVRMRRKMVTPRCWCKVCPRCFQPFLVKKCNFTRERITNKLQCNRSKTKKNSLPCLLILAINVILDAFLFTNTSQLTCSLSWQEKKKCAHSHSLTRSTNELRKGAGQNVYCKAWQQSKLRLPFFNQSLVEVGKESWAIHRHMMYTSQSVFLTGITYKRNPNQTLWNWILRLMTPRDVNTKKLESYYSTELVRCAKKDANSFLHLAPGVSAWWAST